MMSELGRETVSAYAAAKGGLKMLTKNIASEYGEANIQCNALVLGILQLHKQLRYVNSRRMVLVIHLINLLSRRPLQLVGVKLRI